MKKTRTSTARSKAFVEAAKLQSGEMSTIKDSNDEDLIPSRSTIARVVARHVNDSSDSNQQHCHSSAFKRDRGPPDRSSAMERCLHDRSGPKRMRRADVDLRQPRRDHAIQECVLTRRSPFCPCPFRVRKSHPEQIWSALPQIADVGSSREVFSVGPQAAITRFSANHLVGLAKQQRRNGNA